MSRTGMANPILHLRELGAAGTSEFTQPNGTVVYFTDQHLQDILDSFRQDVYAAPMETQGTVDYYFDGGVWEEGTAQFQVANAAGGTVTPSSFDYAAGHVQFSATQGGTAYFLTGRKYDVFAAAADVWAKKAAAVASGYDVASDGSSLTRSQMKAQFTEMSELCSSMALPCNARMLRPDL